MCDLSNPSQILGLTSKTLFSLMDETSSEVVSSYKFGEGNEQYI